MAGHFTGLGVIRQLEAKGGRHPWTNCLGKVPAGVILLVEPANLSRYGFPFARRIFIYVFSGLRFSHAPLMKSRSSGMSFSMLVCQRLGLYSNTRSMLSMSKSGPVPSAFVSTPGFFCAMCTRG